MYKLIFMDINMPGLNGVSTTQYIREFLREKDLNQPCIVAHTAIPPDQFGEHKEKGFDEFLGKPVSLSMLQQITRNCLEEEKLDHLIDGH